MVLELTSELFGAGHAMDEEFLFTEGSAADVDAAVEAARSAWIGQWRDCGPARRRQLLLQLADAIVDNAQQLALCDCLDMGKPITAASGKPARLGGPERQEDEKWVYVLTTSVRRQR